jgi:hypothetical protein
MTEVGLVRCLSILKKLNIKSGQQNFWCYWAKGGMFQYDWLLNKKGDDYGRINIRIGA